MAKKLSQTKAAVAARARTRARILETARAMNAAASKTAPMTKGERFRAYLKTPEGQQKLRQLHADVVNLQIATLKSRMALGGVQLAVAEAQLAVSRFTR